MYYYTYYESPIGKIVLANDGDSLVGLWFEGQKYFPDAFLKQAAEKDNMPVFKCTKDWLDRYFAGKRPLPEELPLSPAGSDFRRMIWKYLCEIPYGELTTYGTLAGKIVQSLGKKSMSAQAVGGAVSHNPISIIIPCHRVVGTNGSLTGYAGGLERKIHLLTLEGVDMKKVKL